MNKTNLKPESQQRVLVEKQRVLHFVLLITVALSSAAFFPFVFDSFIAPKILIICLGLSVNLALLLYYKIRFGLNLNRLPVWVTPLVLFILAMFLLVVSFSSQPLERSLYGQFGRGNGVLYYTCALFVSIIAAATYNDSSLHLLTRVIYRISWFFGVYALLQQVGIDVAKLDSRGLSTVVLTFGNSNFSGAMLAILFTFIASTTLAKKKVKSIDFALLAILLLGVFLTGALQGFLIAAMAISILLPMWIYSQAKFHYVRKTVFSGWIITYSLFVAGIFGYGPLARIFDRPSFQMRIEYWKIGIRVIRDNLLLGVGPDRLYDVTPEYMTPNSLSLLTDTRMDNPHNWFIHFGASFGLFALFALVALLVFVFAGILLRFQGTVFLYNPHFPLLLTLAAIVIDGLVSIEQPGLGIWMYLLLGLLIGVIAQPEKFTAPHKDSVKPPKKQVHILPVVATALVFMIASTATVVSRVVDDAVLRHNVQNSINDPLNQEALDKIVKYALKLKSEPEYIVQAVPPLARAGDGKSLLQISKAYYEHNPSSIQAIGIRAQVLSVVESIRSSCPLQAILIKNTPWRKENVEKYLVCQALGYPDANSVTNTQSINNYFDFTFRANFEAGNNFEKILARAIEARLNFGLERRIEAEKLRRILLPELDQLKFREPNLRYENIDTLLSWP